MSKLGAVLAGSRDTGKRSSTGTFEEKAEELLAGCHPRQRAFVADEARRIAALTGGRCGKTTGGRARLVRRMLLTPRANCLFIADTRATAEELVWLPLKDLVERLSISASWNETKLVCTFRDNGARLKLVGADDKREINKLRGVPRHEVGIDEAASHQPKLLEQLIERVLEPRLGDYDGTLWLTGTPGHVLAGPFYEITRPGSERTGWSVHQWSMQDAAPHVPAIASAWRLAQVNKERNGWGDDHPVWKREYLGLWAADDTENVFRYRPHDDDGKPWNQWDPERDPATKFATLPDGDWEYVFGIDMGHSDPFALVILAANARTNELRQVYEFSDKGLHVRDIAKLLVGTAWVDRVARGEDVGNPGGLVGITGWPYAIVADTTHLGGAILDELREVYAIPVDKAEQKHKHDAIELTNGDLVDGRFKILKGSQLEKQILELQWAVDDIGRLKEQKGFPNHLTDAMVYARRAAMHLTGGVAEVTEEPEQMPVKFAPPMPPGMEERPRNDFDMAPGDFDYGDDEW